MQARGQDGLISSKFSFCVFIELAWSIKDLLYGIKNTEKTIFVLVYFRAPKIKEASYLQKWRRVSVFSFSSSIPTEKLQKLFLLSRKIFAKENFRAPASTSAKCYCGNKTGNPERALSLHLARSGSQSQRRIWFILPARGACQIIKVFIPLCRCVELCIVSMICNYA